MNLYVSNYRKFRTEFYTVKEEYQDVLREALRNLRLIYNGLKDPGDVIIIEVEGYDCLAYISDNYLPCEIYNTVVPFSYEEKKVFPEQDIIQEFCFKR